MVWHVGPRADAGAVLTEAQTFNALKNNALGRCPSCHTTTLAVTNAQPDTVPIATNHGLAVVPAWAFHPSPWASK